MKQLLTLLSAIILMVGALSAQRQMTVTKYSAVDGLKVANWVKVDTQRYAWLLPIDRSEKYIQQFDGRKFNVVNDVGSRNSRIDVSGLMGTCYDNKGFLWYPTDSGLVQFKDGGIHQRINIADGLPSDTVMGVRSVDQGIYALTFKGIVFLPFPEYSDQKVIVIDTSFIVDLYDKTDREEYLYVGFANTADNGLLFTMRLESDSVDDQEIKSIILNQDMSFEVKSYDLPIHCYRMTPHPKGVLARTIEGMYAIYPDGRIEAIGKYLERYIGTDKYNRIYMLENNDGKKTVVRDDVNELSEFGRTKNFYRYPNSKQYEVFEAEKVENELWSLNGKQVIIIGERSLLPLRELYPDIEQFEDEMMSYPGDGLLWVTTWGEIGVSTIKFEGHVNYAVNPREPNGMWVTGFTSDKSKIIYFDDNYEKEEGLSLLDVDDYRFERMDLPVDIGAYRTYALGMNRGYYSGLNNKGEFWMWLEHKEDGHFKCFQYINDMLTEQPEVAEMIESSIYHDISIFDHSWAFLHEKHVVVRLSNGNSEKIDLPEGFQAKWLGKMNGKNFAVKNDSTLYMYWDGAFLNLTESHGINLKLEWHDDFLHDGTTAVLNMDNKVAYFRDGQVHSLDTITYPVLSKAKYAYMDNLGRIITFVSTDESKNEGLMIVLDGEEYQLLTIRNIMDDLWPVVYYYTEDDLLMYTSYNAIYKYDANRKEFYRVAYYADDIGYSWDEIIIDDFFYLSGWNGKVLRLDLRFSDPDYPEVMIREVRVDDQITEWDSNLVIDFGEHLSMDLYCRDEAFFPHVYYQYKLKVDGNWSRPISVNRFDFESLKPGIYEIQIRAKGENEVWGDPTKFYLTVAPPWYRSNLAVSSFVIAVVLIFWLGTNLNSRRLRLKNERLKEIIDDRTQEIREKNEEIVSSISYAKRIQEAILPPASYVSEHLTDSFILYKPKDIVAGDFYWLDVVGDDVFFAAADCTGHGVPGAMVSVVCANALNRVVNEMKISEPAKILDKTRELVVETFERSEHEVKDGMDISFCRLNKKTKKLSYSGAHNPLYHVIPKPEEEGKLLVYKDLALVEYKGDKQPIGKFAFQKPFNQTDLQLNEGDIVYLSSDGYADQFGGPKGRKYMYKPFKKLLLNISQLPMEQQKRALDEEFNKWKGEEEQIDDVCVIGVRV